jgi:hypothetical protein
MNTPMNRLKNGPAVGSECRRSADATFQPEIEQSSQQLAQSMEKVDAALATGAAQQSQQIREELTELREHLVRLVDFVRHPLQSHVRKLNSAGALTTAQRERFRDLFQQLADELNRLEGIPLCGGEKS